MDLHSGAEQIGSTDHPSAALRPHASRRLEALSDIVFGLAMTFLVSRLPISRLPPSGPTWRGVVLLFGPYLFTLLMSFSIAGLYWFSHHRRLLLTPRHTSFAVVLNFAFLFVVMLLPTTSAMYGTYGNAGSMVSIYCAHLSLLSLLHLLLWLLTIRSSHRPGGRWLPWGFAVAPAFGSTVFISAAITALWRPDVSALLLFAGFLSPFVARLALA